MLKVLDAVGVHLPDGAGPEEAGVVDVLQIIADDVRLLQEETLIQLSCRGTLRFESKPQWKKLRYTIWLDKSSL